MLVTDAGLAYFPKVDSSYGFCYEFLAPELKNRKEGDSMVTESDKCPGRADIYSLGKLVMLIALGD